MTTREPWWQSLPPPDNTARALRPLRLRPMPRRPGERRRLPHPTQMRRLVVNYDDDEHCNPGEEPRPAIAYGVQFPDKRIVLWHVAGGYVDWHRTRYALHARYAEHGSCHVEFLDSRV